MKILHCVTDEKFIDGAIGLYNQDDRIDNHWIHFTKETSLPLKYIKSSQVEIKKIDDFGELVCGFDVVILHSLPSLPVQQILSIPSRIKVVWFAWGYDMYDGWKPLLPLPLYLSETSKIYKFFHKAPTFTKAIKRKIKDLIIPCQYKVVLPRIDYFSGVFPYEYDLLKNRYHQFRAVQLDYYYASPDFFIKDACPKDITNRMCNIMIGNSANITNNHVDVIKFVNKYIKLSPNDKIIIPLSYGGWQEYVDIVKEKALDMLGNKATVLPLDTYLPIDEYWNLASNCRIAIYAHVRQQASDNIFYQIMSGAKVYMTKRSEAFSYLRSIGLKVFSLEDDYESVNTSLSYEEVMHNRETLTKLYSVSSHIKRIKDINTILLSNK